MNPLRLCNHCLIEKIKSEQATVKGSKRKYGFKWRESPWKGEEAGLGSIQLLGDGKRKKSESKRGIKC